MSVSERVRELVLPALAERGLELYDVELAGAVLRIVVDRPTAGEPLDLDLLSDATRAVSRALDAGDPIAGRYTLEVTSPGLERRLRTRHHFERAVGEKVRIRTAPGVATDRRVEGVLATADAAGIGVETTDDAGEPTMRHLSYEDIDRARTVFVWGADPSEPSGGRRGGHRRPHGNQKHTKELEP